jgi:hypothetical protein
MIKSIYISGPMGGMPGLNHDLFNSVAEKLRQKGYEVLNPAQNGVSHDSPREVHMHVDLQMLMTANAVLTLPDWQGSRGARLEVEVAEQIGIPIIIWESLIESCKCKQA